MKLAAHRRPYLLTYWAWGANLYWKFTRHWNNPQYYAAKLSLPHATEFLQNCPQFGHAPSKERQPFPRPKILK